MVTSGWRCCACLSPCSSSGVFLALRCWPCCSLLESPSNCSSSVLWIFHPFSYLRNSYFSVIHFIIYFVGSTEKGALMFLTCWMFLGIYRISSTTITIPTPQPNRSQESEHREQHTQRQTGRRATPQSCMGYVCFYILFLVLYCVLVNIWGHPCALAHTWEAEDSLQGSFLDLGLWDLEAGFFTHWVICHFCF